MYMKRLMFLLLTMLFFVDSTAQENSRRDSLINQLPKAKNDTNLVHLYYDIGYEYSMNDYEKAKEYYQKAKKLSENLNFKKGLVLYTAYYGNILKIKGEYDSALILDKEAIRISKELDDKLLIAKSYVNTGNVFHYRRQYDSTIYYYETAKKYAGNNPRLSAQISNLLMPAYLDLGRKKEAVQQGEAALAYFRTASDPSMLGQVLLNLGSAYEESGNPKKARELLKEALQISRDIGFDELRLHCLVSLIHDFLRHKKGSDPLLLEYADEALPIAQKQGNMMGVALIYRGKGNHYKFKREYQKALEYLDSSLSVATTHQLIKEQQEGLFSKGLLLTAMGNLEAGNELLNEAAALEDSLVNKDIREQVLMVEKRFESEKKENQIKLQESKIKQKNLFNSILMGSILSLLLILLLLYRNYKHRQKIQKAKIEELETEKQLLAVQSLLKGQEDERSRLAKDLHDGLGGMLSGVKLELGAMKGNLILTEDNVTLFNNALNKLDQSISEMRRVAHNMMPEALLQLGLEHALQDYCKSISSSGNFTLNTEFYGLEKRLDSATEVTIYRIVQELVNNAVKHSGAERILVQVLRRDKTLNITVEDNGNGFDTVQWQNKISAGLQNIQSRVNYLGGILDIKSVPGKGTSVYIECTIEDNGEN
jgi:two-component system NarL family sensor kinase